jgi:hypothetical protein
MLAVEVAGGVEVIITDDSGSFNESDSLGFHCKLNFLIILI